MLCCACCKAEAAAKAAPCASPPRTCEHHRQVPDGPAGGLQLLLDRAKQLVPVLLRHNLRPAGGQAAAAVNERWALGRRGVKQLHKCCALPVCRHGARRRRAAGSRQGQAGADGLQGGKRRAAAGRPASGHHPLTRSSQGP